MNESHKKPLALKLVLHPNVQQARKMGLKCGNSKCRPPNFNIQFDVLLIKFVMPSSPLSVLPSPFGELKASLGQVQDGRLEPEHLLLLANAFGERRLRGALRILASSSSNIHP